MNNKKKMITVESIANADKIQIVNILQDNVDKIKIDRIFHDGETGKPILLIEMDWDTVLNNPRLKKLQSRNCVVIE